MEIDQRTNYQYINGGLRTSAILVLGLLALFLLAKSINEFKSYSVIGRDVASNNTITVSGKGEIVAKPDIATFTFGVTEESLSVADAQTRSAKSINAIKDYLLKNGVSENDIKTTTYNISPRYDWVEGTSYRSGHQVLAAYVVAETDEVKVRNLADAGKLIGGLGELGANNVSGLTFGFDKEEVVKSQARQAAVDQAKTNAEDIAKSLGVTLGRVVSFNESNQLPPVVYGLGMGAAMKSEAAVPDITPGENKVTSNVTITYELK